MRLTIWLIIGFLAVNQFLIGSLIPKAIGRPIHSESMELDMGIIPMGIPEVYGAELDISYDDVSLSDPKKADATIEVMSKLDRTIELSGNNLERYIDILYHQHGGISCEYCCGVQSIIFENGEAACGCAHSFAMRGLAKYLILEHGDSMIDVEILTEIGKWKVLFFPGIHTQKAAVMEAQGIEVDYISLTTNANRGIEQ